MTDPDDQRLLDRVTRYVARSFDRAAAGAPGDRFDELARAAFAFQHRRVAPVRALAEARGVAPEDVRSWRDVPPVPALAYKSLDLRPVGLGGHSGEIVFRSSGTTRPGAGGAEAVRSVHRHPFPGLYRTVIDASFSRFCLPGRGAGGEERVPMLSLVPPRADAPDSSLSFMVDHVLSRWGSGLVDHPSSPRPSPPPRPAGLGADGGEERAPPPEPLSGVFSTYTFGKDGLDADAAGRWCRRVEGAGRPAVVLATAFSLASWLDALAAGGDRFRLPPGSVLFETGGFKGRTRELSRPELLARVEERLGLPAGRPDRPGRAGGVVREYGMTELTSQLYTDTLDGGGSHPEGDLFVPPPWVRVRVLDPESLGEAAPGEAGLVAIFDLANLSSAVHVLTEDLGAMEPLAAGSDRLGLRLLGRAAGAELRGCSLTAEEMALAR